MSATGTATGTGRQRLRSAARFSIVALAVAAVVLAVLVWRAVADGPSETADVGEQVPLAAAPYGRELTFLLPGSATTVIVAPPVDTVAHEQLDVEYDDPRWSDQQDLDAPDGGVLVPVSFRTQANGGFLQEDDPTPITIRLVAGDERVDLASTALNSSSATSDAFDSRSVAVALEGEADVDDLAVEVEYDGVTQTARVSSGEIDAGVAQALYDDPPSVATGCTDVVDSCPLVAADPDAPVRPDRSNFLANDVGLYAYDSVLGWAPEGSLWAATRLHLFGSSGAVNASGRYWSVARQSAPVVTLDGAEPVHREGLKSSASDTIGRVVFEVDADAVPRELVIEQEISLEGARAPADVALRAEVALGAVR